MLSLARLSNVPILRFRASMKVMPHVSIRPSGRSGDRDCLVAFLLSFVDAEPATSADRRSGGRMVRYDMRGAAFV